MDESTPKPVRRFLRFSLRSLLIVTTLASVLLGWVAYEMKQSREIESAISETGAAKLTCNSHVPFWLRTYLGEYFLATVEYPLITAKDDSQLAQIERFVQAKRLLKVSVVFLEEDVTNDGLEHLKGIPSLTFMVIRMTITDRGLENLGGLTDLTTLYIRNECEITDVGMKHFRGMTKLETLVLQGIQITDAGIEHLRGLTSLKELELRGARITDTGLESLRGLSNLQSLMLVDS